MKKRIGRLHTWEAHFCDSLDLSLGKSVVVDPKLIDKSHERTPSLVVTDSSSRQPVSGQETSSDGHVAKFAVDVDLGFPSGRVIGSRNVSPFILENNERVR